MKKKLFVCRSYYHIYIALKYIDNLSNTCILCIDKQFDIKMLYRMKEKINQKFNNVEVKISSTSYFDLKKHLDNNYDEIYLFHWVVHKMPEMYIYKKFYKSKFFMAEDGVNHYGGIQKSIINKKIYIKYLINYFIIGKKDLTQKRNVEGIYVTYLEKYPKYMKPKLKSIESKYSEDKNMNYKILDIFDIKIPNSDNGIVKNVLVFTQPLSEDGFISEDVKVRIYTYIVEELEKKGYKVFFKSHPREITSYEFSKGVIKLEKDFPAEILNFTGVDFNAAIAVSSGSIDTINAKRKIKLYPEFFETLNYTDMEHTIKNRVKDL